MPAPSSASGRAPRVTIGVPVRNGAALLPRALDALLAQTFADFEVVVSDNASTDGTLAVAREYAARDPRVRAVPSDVDLGGNGNFMRVLDLARGEYFKWAAHDDVCAPSFLERCVAVLDADPSVVCCHTRTVKVDDAGRPVPGLPDPTRASAGGADPRPHVRFRDVLLHTGYAARSYGVIRTAALRACRPLLPVYGSEKVLMAELGLRGRYHDVDEVLFHERVHDAASSALPTAALQQGFAAPARRAGRLAPRFRLLGGYLGAIRRAPIGPAARARCALAVVAYLFQARKWRAVAASVAGGTGTGGRQRAEVARARAEETADARG